MKMMIRTYLAWTFCLLFLTGITLSSFGNVLCLGDTGHIKTGSTCQPCYSDPEKACLFEQTAPEHDHHDECTNCVDLPLIQNSPSYRRMTPKVVAGSVAFHSITIFNKQHIEQTTLVNTAPLVDTLLPFSAGVLLSTTILLC